MIPCKLNPTAMLKVLEKMENVLKGIGTKPKLVPTVVGAPAKWQQLGHALGMIGIARDLVNTGHYDKANRWIGFIQGTLWCNDLMSVDQLRLINESLHMRLE